MKGKKKIPKILNILINHSSIPHPIVFASALMRLGYCNFRNVNHRALSVKRNRQLEASIVPGAIGCNRAATEWTRKVDQIRCMVYQNDEENETNRMVYSGFQ